MTTGIREKFATQVDADILSSVRLLAQKEGRQLQSLIDEALSDLLTKRAHATPRAHVMRAYNTSHGTFAPLYQKLAK